VCQLNKPTQCEVHLAPREASPGQLAAWAWLWTRLLGQGSRVPDTRQPQDPVEPGAATVATVGSGHTLLSEHTRQKFPLGKCRVVLTIYCFDVSCGFPKLLFVPM